MEESRSRWLRTCRRQKQALAEYEMFWGLRLYTRIYFFRTILWHRKRHAYISKHGVKLIITKKPPNSFAIALDFLFIKLLTAQNLFRVFLSCRGISLLSSTTGRSRKRHGQWHLLALWWAAFHFHLEISQQPAIIPSSVHRYNGQISRSDHISWCWSLDVGAFLKTVCPTTPQDRQTQGTFLGPSF